MGLHPQTQLARALVLRARDNLDTVIQGILDLSQYVDPTHQQSLVLYPLGVAAYIMIGLTPLATAQSGVLFF